MDAMSGEESDYMSDAEPPKAEEATKQNSKGFGARQLLELKESLGE